MQVCFFWNDLHYQDVDVSSPEAGNPGIGGTDYLMVSLPYELNKLGVCEVVLLHLDESNKVPASVPSAILNFESGLSNVLQLRGWSPDIIIARASDARKLAQLTPPGTKIIAWAHNHLRLRDLEWLAQCDKIVAVVNVGEEQLLLTRLSPCYKKSTFIHNGFYSSGHLDRENAKLSRAVYLGALIPEKGFHRLAKLWPKILKLSPKSWLDVIGGADVYGGSRSLGRLGVADAAYENLLLKNLGTSTPEAVNVKFHGRLGASKLALLKRALVGLPNPTGFTETFCLSAVEMADAGCAVVAPRRWGFMDTVIHSETGILTRNDDEYIRAVADALNDVDKASKMGIAGNITARERFTYSRVCTEWLRLFEKIQAGDCVSTKREKFPAGEYPHAFIYRARKPSRFCQRAADVMDSLYGLWLKR